MKRIRIAGRSFRSGCSAFSFLSIFFVLGVVTTMLASNITGITEVLPVYEANLCCW
ncbi:MAG: hypothetical protein R2818_13835 [Flavobacteriales bacterium]